MCGRFYIDADDAPEELMALLNRAELLARKRDPDFHLKRGEICPGDHAAVIAMNRSMTPMPFAMLWGFRLEKRLIINARSETAADKQMFRQSMQDRRCLIPVSAYFEWDHREKPLVKYRFHSEQPMMYLAGLYRFEATSDAPVFTILTREAAPDIACFHDRMPVIMPHALCGDWLDRRQAPAPLLKEALTSLRYHRT